MVPFSLILSHVALTLTLSSCDAVPINYTTDKTKIRGNKLIMILLDGFRWDYFEIKGLKGFKRLMKRGVKAKYMTPDFPSESYPNHYSITTGLHVESHGMVGNYMYDPSTNDTFRMGFGDNDTDPKWWNAGEPIWITAKKQGKKSVMYYWLGCDVLIRGLRPDYCATYVDGTTARLSNFKSMIDRGIKKLKDDDAHLVGLYIEDPDHFGHRYGPFSKELNQTIREIDKHIYYLQDQLEKYQLTREVNIMIMSDHGMTQMDKNKIINITKYISKNDWSDFVDMYKTEWTIEYPMFNIWPIKGKETEVLKKLNDRHPHMHVYERDSIPDDWHYKKNSRVSPLVVTDDLGWYMTTESVPRRSRYRVFNDTGPLQGGHAYGHREKDMRAIFLATGPDFRRGIVNLPQLDIVDLYQIMCHILHITASPNNGTWARAEPYIEETGYRGFHSKLGLCLVAACLFVMMS